jgi:hydroxymethylglutaryl-CoA reductase
MDKTSNLSGFYKLTLEERIKFAENFCSLSEDDIKTLRNPEALDMIKTDHMVENVIGRLQIPLGVATNFLINNKEYLVPMATEEASVIAAASNAARLTREKGGIFTSNSGPVMIAQIQIVNITNPFATKNILLENKDEILEIANAQDPVLIKFGGGAKDIEVRVIDSKKGPMVVVHLVVDTRDAMGANAVNTMAEALAPTIEKITGGKVYLRILSNLADKRIVRARTVIDKELLGGEDVVDGIVLAGAFAEADPYRAVTHNKGIMNGVTAVVLATGNDTRAVEAGAHAYASKSGTYTALTKWEKNQDGDLEGSIEIPMAVGLVGGATATHPIAKLSVKMLGVRTAVELGEIIAAVGLAQNLAACRALATEGIQKGHMSLHAKNIAINAGATGKLIDKVADIMVKERKIRVDRAIEILKEIKELEV